MYTVSIIKGTAESDRLQTRGVTAARQIYRDYLRDLPRDRYQGRIIVRMLDGSDEIQHAVIR